jgi:hypothetical protein
VLLTRTAEMTAAAGTDFLLGAAAVELHPVGGADAAAYLQRALAGPPPAGWEQLLERLHTAQDIPLARTLSTPLTLTLLRDTYRASDDLADLLLLAGHAVRIMRFLEDARARGLLRTVGPLYQFRHARLQDRLTAGPETAPVPPAAPARSGDPTPG